MTEREIENWFTYHAPRAGQPERYEKIREGAKALALAINLCPHGREKALAFTKLEEAVMWANASIGRDGGAPEKYKGEITEPIKFEDGVSEKVKELAYYIVDRLERWNAGGDTEKVVGLEAAWNSMTMIFPLEIEYVRKNPDGGGKNDG